MSNVPKLRFKEFSGEWEENKLEKFCNKIASGKSKQNNEGKYNLYGSTGIIGKTDEYSNDGKFILIARVGANAGLTNVVEGRFGVTDNTLVVDLKDEVDKDFILSLLHKYNLNKLIFGSGQPLITGGQLKTLKLYFPSKQEQEKIASFLTSVDTKIEQLTKKETLLTSYKKGVMQKIFSGEIRFKADDGSEFCDWEEKKLEEVLTEPKKVAVKNPNVIELLTVQLHCKGVKRSGNFPAVTKNGRPYYIRNKDELLIGRQNFHNGGIGIVNEETNGYICSNAITSLVAKKDNIRFLYLYLSRIDYYKKIDDLIGGTGQKEISKTELNKLEILIPCIEEQTKIANFLSSIDSKIEQVQKQLDSTKKFKKALLQQMFV